MKGAIFDIDGTLIDSMSVWDSLSSRYLVSQGVEPEPGLDASLSSMTVAEGVTFLKEKYLPSYEEEDIRAGIQKRLALFYRAEVTLKPGVQAFLSALNEEGVPMALATVGETELLKAALKRLGVLSFFQYLVTAEELHTSKREPLIYEECLARLNLEADEVWVFEDAPEAIASAKKAGCHVAAVSDPSNQQDRDWIAQHADLLIADFRDPALRELLSAKL